jgi:hypothetical protein
MEKAIALYQAYGGLLAPQPAGAEQPPPSAAPEANDQQESPIMGIGLLTALLPMVLQLFAPKVQQQLGKITGQSSDQLAPFVTQLFQTILQVTGQTDPVSAVAALKAKAAAATPDSPAPEVKAVEDSAVDYLDKVGPLFDKLADLDKARWAAEQAGRDAASARYQRDIAASKWDMTKMLVLFAGLTSTALVLSLAGAIIYQALTGEQKIDTALVGLAGPLLAIAMGVWREIFSYRFDGTPTSNAAAAIENGLQRSTKGA